ncbi:acetyl-CoA synthetase-like protein [Aspergillus ellipticus CBS 707.79]|uniref:Acetyl-CoA synthetase-like protein n=1 Tax=Aspergillus ellipticus CBS 707.79 TaxID=1448320 RepID=A0A319CT71_9EURO|nr:acetyl-CoA synthetase-like protein [Aspergillus ellipticus CBS 707.79]
MTATSEIATARVADDPRRPLERFDEVVREHPDKLALVCRHQRPDLYQLKRNVPADIDHGQWTFREIGEGVSRLSKFLETQGVVDGCLVFLLLGNSIEHVLATWAAYRLGCVHVSMLPDSLSNTVEARHIIQTVLEQRAAPRAAFVVKDRQMADQFDQLFPELDCLKVIVESTDKPSWVAFETALSQRDIETAQRSNTSERSIFFSSGTTSLPKPCFVDILGWITSLESRSTFGAFAPGDRVMLFAITRGATLVYSSYLSFEPLVAMETLKANRCAYMVMLGTLAHAVTSAMSVAPGELPCPDTVIFGGMILSTDVAKAFQEATGTRAIENLYGMTEGVLCTSGRVENINRISRDGVVSAGQPTSGARIRICAPESTVPVPRGVVGELHYSGYQTIIAYIGVSSDAFHVDEEGTYWYKTGDQAVIDENDGQVYPVGRYKDMIIPRGKNISLAAIESVLNKDPGCAPLNPQVVLLPDQVAGEVPVVIVNRDVDHGQVQRMMGNIRTQMGLGYVPDKVLSIQSLGMKQYPVTTSGKVQKTKLAALVRKHEANRAQRSSAPALDPLATRHQVTHIWAETLGTTTQELDLHAKMSQRVDSITSMRVHAKLRRLTGRDVPFPAWAAATTIAEQMILLESAPERGASAGASKPQLPHSRQGGPGLEEMAHLVDNAGQQEATHAIIQQALMSCGLGWDDVADVFPATDFHDIMTQTHLIDTWEFFIAVRTWDTTTQKLRSALETALTVHPMLRSFIVIDETAAASERSLHVTIQHSQKILDRCIVDYGVVATMQDIRRLTINFPAEHRIAYPGPMFRALLVFVEEINSAVLVGDCSHSIMDATYYELFADDLDQALDGRPLRPHIPYKLWNDCQYLLQDSLAARPALDYHVGQMRRLTGRNYALWPTPTPIVEIAPERINAGLPLLEFSLPTLMTLRHHHPTIMTPVVLKTALTLLALFHTKHNEVLLLNVEAARSSFPFMPSSLPRGSDLDGARVAGPTLTSNVELLTYNPNETVLDLLYRVQAQQRLNTKHAHTPWRRIMEKLPPVRELYPLVADHLIFNWTGASTFEEDSKKRLHQNIKLHQIFFRPKTGLMLDGGASGKDGTDFCISLTGAVANRSTEGIGRIGDGLRTITTWLTAQENWERPVRNFSDCLGVACTDWVGV